jgi:4-amino-4-deoxy-L-arabinose transferase-like glycosyltransferase
MVTTTGVERPGTALPPEPAAGVRRLLARPGPLVWAILITALVARVAYVLSTDVFLLFDPADYARHAQSLAEGHGYPGSQLSGPGDPTALRMPLYPLFLAAIHVVTGGSWEAARLAQALMGTVTVALIGLLGRRLFDRRIGLTAMAAAAVFPPFVLLGGTLMSENLLLPLELGAVLAVLEHRRAQSGYRWAVVAGVLCGLGMLTRPNAIILVIALAIGVWTARTGGWRPVAVLVIAAAIVYAPWPVRNAVSVHAFVPLSTEGGIVATSMYNDYSRNLPGKKPGAWVAPWQHKGNRSLAIVNDKALTEPQMDSQLTAEARHYIRQNPEYPAEVAFWNSARLLHIVEGNPWWHWQNIGVSKRAGQVAQFAFYPVLLLAIAGVVLGRPRRVPLFVWLIPALMWASLVFLNNEPRARAPIDPFILLLAALGAVAVWGRLRGDPKAV